MNASFLLLLPKNLNKKRFWSINKASPPSCGLLMLRQNKGERIPETVHPSPLVHKRRCMRGSMGKTLAQESAAVMAPPTLRFFSSKPPRLPLNASSGHSEIVRVPSGGKESVPYFIGKKEDRV